MPLFFCIPYICLANEGHESHLILTSQIDLISLLGSFSIALQNSLDRFSLPQENCM